jgi:hypothetical protein
LPIDRGRSERCQVRGHELAVEQGEMANAKAGNEPGHCHLRCIRHSTEHRLPEEGPAQFHSVKTADELAAVPAFDGMRVADGVQAQRCPLYHRIDPGLIPVGASEQDFMKCAIAGDREPARAHALRKRVREVKCVEGDDCPTSRLDPEDVPRIAAVGHGEDAGGISP